MTRQEDNIEMDNSPGEIKAQAAEDLETDNTPVPAEGGKEGTADIDHDLDQLTILKEENKECRDKLLRLAAEFENYKRRQAKEYDNALKYAAEDILKQLLPTIDNLERALDHHDSKNSATMIEGIELTLKGLTTMLNKFGVEPILSTEQPFDPNIHEAMVMEASSEVPAQHVIREFEKGYRYKDRLLRAAKVVVSKGAE
ncbi:nucleotide exchange factor GrpE [Desulfobacterota bacterium M19]